MNKTIVKEVDQGDTLSWMGKLIPAEKTVGRDAVHIAVIQVVAGCELHPGDHVGYLHYGDWKTVGLACAIPLGVVDPFIKGHVDKGDSFLMLLYPRSISSLRHVWSHPGIGVEE